MKILITGSNGFVAKNLIARLNAEVDCEILAAARSTSDALLCEYTKKCDFVFHLAGVSRTDTEEEFIKGNCGYTERLLDMLRKNGNKAPLMVASSGKISAGTPYGNSKKTMEDIVLSYAEGTGSDVFIYRFCNIFGKWSRPNYNSVVATFCHNIARGLPIDIHNPASVVELVYIDDVIDELLACLHCKVESKKGFCEFPPKFTTNLKDLSELIYSFKRNEASITVDNLCDEYTRKMYSTYFSFLPETALRHCLKMNCDPRGSFTEILKSNGGGQISVNISKPGITKGGHWHGLKCEKFCVVSGSGIICLRSLDGGSTVSYSVSSDKIEIIDIPPGYTHSITNTGESDMATLMWCSESFDSNAPDTWREEV